MPCVRTFYLNPLAATKCDVRHWVAFRMSTYWRLFAVSCLSATGQSRFDPKELRRAKSAAFLSLSAAFYPALIEHPATERGLVEVCPEDRFVNILQGAEREQRREEREGNRGIVELAAQARRGVIDDGGMIERVICPLLSGPKLMIFWITKETRNAEQEASPGRDYRQAA